MQVDGSRATEREINSLIDSDLQEGIGKCGWRDYAKAKRRGSVLLPQCTTHTHTHTHTHTRTHTHAHTHTHTHNETDETESYSQFVPPSWPRDLNSPKFIIHYIPRIYYCTHTHTHTRTHKC